MEKDKTRKENPKNKKDIPPKILTKNLIEGESLHQGKSLIQTPEEIRKDNLLRKFQEEYKE